MTFEENYPFIASWVMDGEVHIGQAESWLPTAAVIDAGGVIWQTNEPFDSIDAILERMEKEIAKFCKGHGIELVDKDGNALPFPE